MADGSIELILDVRTMLSSPQPVMSAVLSTFGDLPGVNIELKESYSALPVI